MCYQRRRFFHDFSRLPCILGIVPLLLLWVVVALGHSGSTHCRAVTEDFRMPLATCPSLAELERLLLGELPEQDVERLEQHVQGCNACREQLVQLRTKVTVAA